MLRFAVAILALLLPTTVYAQNLLLSFDFDAAGDVADWPDPFPDPNLVISWEPPPMDVDGSPTSGSLRLETSITSGASDGPRQCVAAGAGIEYLAEGWVFAPTQVPQPFPSISVYYYGTGSCTGPDLGVDSAFPAGVLDSWDPIQLILTTPPGTASVGFRPLSGNTIDPTRVVAFFDALYLPEPDASPAIGCGLALLLALSRRRARA